ncbi:transporter substrate-binding domain-containing protein [Aquabacterium sp. A7-Y]|uniref:substrate-binding periplasmic protein n=1 Tax=Aquabacterium sp. A7-Y TaxID=1349605 RepID=UPI00223CFA67|nr:transporter substrate-binding domain-containing protein [Aquabacterium sp. A7-Y]MCW7537883.1 transporter substrate-binding domain-containing protein [Aquabacterium sp. A7-Y]
MLRRRVRAFESLMPSRPLSTCLLAWLLSGLAGAAPAQAPPRETVGVDTANAPFMYERDGRPAGVYPTLLLATFARMKTPLDLKVAPWNRIMAAVEQGQAGAVGVYSNAERRRRYDFSEPLYTEKIFAWAPAHRAATLRSLADLKGLRVGVLRGWSYGDAFDAAVRDGSVRAEVVAEDTYNFRKLAARRLDVVLAVEQAGAAQLRSGRYPGVAASAAPMLLHPAHLVFLRQAGKGALLDRFNIELRELRSSGDYQRLVDGALATFFRNTPGASGTP